MIKINNLKIKKIKAVKINIKIEYIQSNILTVSATYFFKSFCHISFYTKRLQKKVSTHRGLVTIFYFTRPMDRKRTTF